MIEKSAGWRNPALASTIAMIRDPLASVAFRTLRFGSPTTLTTPSATCRWPAGTPHCRLAGVTSVRHASAAAARNTGPNMRVVNEPKVPRSGGHWSVSPSTMSIERSATPSSSATICACEVITP